MKTIDNRISNKEPYLFTRCSKCSPDYRVWQLIIKGPIGKNVLKPFFITICRCGEENHQFEGKGFVTNRKVKT